MAATTADAEKMLEARDKTGKILTIGYQYRYNHANQVAKKVIDDGWLGEIYYAEAAYVRRRGVPTWGVFTDKAQQGGGPLIDIGTHALDNCLWLMNNYEVDYVVGATFEKLGRLLDPSEQGQVSWFQAKPDPWDNKTFEVEDSAVGFVKMKNGAVIHLKASWALNMITNPALFLACGTKGGIDTYEDQVRLNHVVAEQQAITMVGEKVSPFIPGYSAGEAPPSREVLNFVKTIKGEDKQFVTADQAFVVTKVLDSIYQSSKTGKAVHF